MARIRSIKPEVRTSLVVTSWTRDVRYLWVLLWGYLDDEGRGVDDPSLIKADCLPRDEDATPPLVDEWLSTIAAPVFDAEEAPLCRYTVGGRRYLHCVNWDEHQRPSHPRPSRIPKCPVHEQTGNATQPEVTREPQADDVTHTTSNADVTGATSTPSDAPQSNVTPEPQDSGKPQVSDDSRDPREDVAKPSGHLPRNGSPEQWSSRAVEQGSSTNYLPHEDASPPTPDPPPARSARETDPDPFDSFWDTYPRKVGKKAARRAWKTAVKDTPPDVIITAAQRFAAQRHGQDPRYTPHPATWLNAGRWLDEPDQPPARAAPARDGTSVFDRARERLALTTGGDP